MLYIVLTSGSKVNFPDGLWWPSWIYADYESCPRLPAWQQSWICSRTPVDYESPKKCTGKNFSRFRKCQIDYKLVRWFC